MPLWRRRQPHGVDVTRPQSQEASDERLLELRNHVPSHIPTRTSARRDEPRPLPYANPRASEPSGGLISVDHAPWIEPLRAVDASEDLRRDARPPAGGGDVPWASLSRLAHPAESSGQQLRPQDASNVVRRPSVLAPLPARHRAALRGSGRHKRPVPTDQRFALLRRHRAGPDGIPIGARQRPRHPWRTTTLAALGLVCAIAVVAGVLRTGLSDVLPARNQRSPDRASPTSLSAGALDWLAANAGAGTTVVAPDQIQKQIAAAVPAATVHGYPFASSNPADLVVVAPTTSRQPSELIRRLVARSEPLAVFRDGWQVRHVVNGTSPAKADAVRRTAGRELATDGRIRLTPPAWRSLAEGDVDPRLMGLLATVVGSHTIDVSAFPRTRAERAAGAPAREMRITAIDGELVTENASAVSQVRSMLLGQPRPFRAAEVQLSSPPLPGGLLVRFLLPIPLGLEPPPPSPSKGTP